MTDKKRFYHCCDSYSGQAYVNIDGILYWSYDFYDPEIMYIVFINGKQFNIHKNNCEELFNKLEELAGVNK